MTVALLILLAATLSDSDERAIRHEAYTAMDAMIAAEPGVARYHHIVIKMEDANFMGWLLAMTTVNVDGACVLHFTPEALTAVYRKKAILHESLHCLWDYDVITVDGYKHSVSPSEIKSREAKIRAKVEEIMGSESVGAKR